MFDQRVNAYYQRTDTDAVIYSDGYKAYDGLVNYGYKKHYRIKHDYNVFADGHNHINDIENFRGLCKVKLVKFRLYPKRIKGIRSENIIGIYIFRIYGIYGIENLYIKFR